MPINRRITNFAFDFGEESLKLNLLLPEAFDSIHTNHLISFCKNDGQKMYDILNFLDYKIADNHKLIGYNYIVNHLDDVKNSIEDEMAKK